jgi:hypothetical protein
MDKVNFYRLNGIIKDVHKRNPYYIMNQSGPCSNFSTFSNKPAAWLF